MKILKIKGKEYNLKFGYKSFRKSGILKEVVTVQKKLENSEEGQDKDIESLEEVLNLTSKLVLAALQKNHEEFRADYENPESVRKCTDKVDDLLDNYMDEEDSLPIIDLFHSLVDELFNNGFLSKKSEKLEESLTEQDATVVPTDHKQSEN